MKMNADAVVAEFLGNAKAYADGKQIVVAECPDLDTEITLDGFLQGGGLYPSVTLWCGYNVFDSRDCYSEDELREAVTEFLSIYDDPRTFIRALDTEKEPPPEPEGVPEDAPEDFDAEIREEQLNTAVLDFLEAVYGSGYDPLKGAADEEERFEDIKDQLLCTLSAFDENIYRPGLGHGDYPYADMP